MTEPAHVHRLDGCAPTLLASYLKALGVLRLLSTPTNNVRDEAADPAARGWWQDERFHLRTRLDRDGLVRFFLEDYAPSPIVTPWNGGSGFYYREGQTGEKDPATGKRIKTGVRDASTQATRRLDNLAQSSAPRFTAMARSIERARAVIEEFSLSQAPDPKSGQKAALMQRLRAVVDEQTLQWMDAAVALAGDDFDPAALLGSGANDGNLDFSTTFHSALLELIDPSTGAPSTGAADALLGSLLDQTIAGAFATAVSQFAPGNAAAPNSSTGFSGSERGEPWSLVLMFEGAIAFAAAATRHGEAQRPRGSFPFTVSQLASGSGAVGGEDDSSNRADEIWLPLWSRPATFAEIASLLSEGRATVKRKPARDGLTFARAISTLGVNRGIAEFERLGFEARYGNMFITVPLGRFKVPKDRPRLDLIADLDAGQWLARVRRLAREKSAPARAREAVRRLEDALFQMTRSEHEADGTRAALMALGGLVAWLASSREGRERGAPPPRLGRDWLRRANDGSAEFRVAAALTSLGWEELHAGAPAEDAPETGDEAGDGAAEDAPPPPPSEGGGLDERTGEPARRQRAPPMAAHVAPVEESSVGSRWRRWADNDPPTVVWGAGTLVANMIAVLERRLVEQAMRGLDDKPLAAAAPARLADVAAFLQPGFDNARCAALLAGLIWARPSALAWRREEGGTPVPFAYCALKPLFTPDAALRKIEVLPSTGRLPIPPGLLARLRRGDIDGAVREALARARASALPSPFDPARSPRGSTRFGAGVEAARLAAALLIPIGDRDLKRLMRRAYPTEEPREETEDAS